MSILPVSDDDPTVVAPPTRKAIAADILAAEYVVIEVRSDVDVSVHDVAQAFSGLVFSQSSPRPPGPTAVHPHETLATRTFAVFVWTKPGGARALEVRGPGDQHSWLVALQHGKGPYG